MIICGGPITTGLLQRKGGGDMKYVLIETDRAELNISYEIFSSKEKAHDAMLKALMEGIANFNVNSVEDVIELANQGELGYSDLDAWCEGTDVYGTRCWRIIEVSENPFMKATNIKWHIDEEDDVILPVTVTIPEEIADDPEYQDSDNEEALAEHISDWLSDTYGYCHEGFKIVRE